MTFTIFAKCCISDVWLGSEHVSGSTKSNYKTRYLHRVGIFVIFTFFEFLILLSRHNFQEIPISMTLSNIFMIFPWVSSKMDLLQFHDFQNFLMAVNPADVVVNSDKYLDSLQSVDQ